MKSQINVRLSAEKRKTFHAFCLENDVGLQNVLLACIEALMRGEKLSRNEILARARVLRAEAREL